MMFCKVNTKTKNTSEGSLMVVSSKEGVTDDVLVAVVTPWKDGVNMD
jgi:hypothetical protein